MTNWTIKKTIESDGLETIVIRRPVGETLKGADCVSRTFNAGTIVAVSYGYMDDEWNVIKGEELLTFDANPTEQEVVREVQRKYSGAKVKELHREKVESKTVGIPRDIFAELAQEVTRPDSQKVSK